MSSGTRVIITNLPASTTTSSFRTHLTTAPSTSTSSSAAITDVKVYPKRRFAFVGYKTAEDAARAVNWWNGTWLGGLRIKCEVVDESASIKDVSKMSSKRRSSPPPSSEPTSKRAKQAAAAPAAAATPESAQHAEYMAAMTSKRGKNAGRSWEDLPIVEPASAAEPMVVVEEDAEQEEEEPAEEIAVAAADDEELDDAAWMRKMMSGSLEEPNPEPSMPKEQLEKKNTAVEVVQAPEVESIQADMTPEDLILSTGRLFLRNLAFSCTEAELSELFSPFGSVISVHMPHSAQTKTPLGTAFVLFATPSHALTAYQALDGKAFQGRILHILPGRKALNALGDGAEGGDEKKLGLKGEREGKKKAEASKEFSWGELYMNSDAVVSSIADRMNITKADILDTDSGSSNPAVKLALAETHVIQETKKYFEDEGIQLDSLKSTTRSPTTILIKNIPYGTSVETLREMFGHHGELERLLLPPAGTLAVVEFGDAASARSAFKGLAYKRMGNSVLYLEKGPVGMFSTKPDVAAPKPVATPAATSSSSAPAAAAAAPITEGSPAAANSTLFVKNLAFATTPTTFTATFSSLPGFLFARIQTKPGSTPAHPRLSMGFGFVGFGSSQSAQAAKETINGLKLDGHVLEVKFAQRNTEDEGERKDNGAGGKKGTTTKMIVKNIPFEATKKDIRELFSAYGQLKSVRLPRKFDTKARGFAFLDFLSRRDAETAMAALRHTHLLGRHLVLEWAAEEEDLGKLREDAKDVVKAREEGGMGMGKKSKIVI